MPSHLKLTLNFYSPIKEVLPTSALYRPKANRPGQSEPFPTLTPVELSEGAAAVEGQPTQLVLTIRGALQGSSKFPAKGVSSKVYNMQCQHVLSRQLR